MNVELRSSEARVRSLANVLDTAFRVPGTGFRFGIDPILGLIPGVGDVVGGLLSSYIIVEAVRAGASRHVLLRMLANLGIDTLTSAVPLVGDLFDAAYKSNTRNLSLLQRYLAEPARTAKASRTFLIGLAIALAVIVFAAAALTVWLISTLLGAIT
jgi:hypothetical protein